MSNAMFSRHFFRMIGIMIVLNNCSTSHAAQPGFPTAAPREQVKLLLQDAWMPKQASGTRQYLIEDSSTTLISDDPTHKSLLQTATLYSLSLIALADSFLLTARVDSIGTKSVSSPRVSEMDRSFPKTIHATFSNNGEMSTISGDTQSLCQGGLDATGMRVFELIQSYPKRGIRIGDKWTDTVSAISCRGKIPLHQQIIREYQLLELATWKEYAVAKIQRNVSITAIAIGSESQDHLIATGSGTGTTIFYADRATGFLRESNGYSKSTFTINTNRGSYPFIQSIVTHIQVQ